MPRSFKSIQILAVTGTSSPSDTSVSPFLNSSCGLPSITTFPSANTAARVQFSLISSMSCDTMTIVLHHLP